MEDETNSMMPTKSIEEIKLPTNGFFHSLAWWKHIFPFLHQSTYHRFLLRCQCKFFRDALPPLPRFWTIYPQPNFASLEDLFSRLNQVWDNDSTQAPRLVICLSSEDETAVSEYVPCFEIINGCDPFTTFLSMSSGIVERALANPIKRTYQLREVNCITKHLVREFPEENETEFGTPKLPICAACLKPCNGKKRCSNCKSVKYCTRDCQKKDWSHHKPSCNRLKNLGGKQRIILMNRISAKLFAKGKFQQAETLSRRCLAGIEKLSEIDPLFINLQMSVLHNLGTLLTKQGKLEEAEKLYRRALKVRERVLVVFHPDTVTMVNNLGSLLHDQGKLDEAEALYRHALEGYERMVGVDHPNTLGLVNNLGRVLHDQGKLEEAEALSRRALAGTERVLGVNHPNTLGSASNLGALLQEQGKLEEAEVLFRRALEGQERVLGVDHLNTLNTRGNLGLLFIKRDDESGEGMVRDVLSSLKSPPHSLPETHRWIKKFNQALDAKTMK